MSTTKGAILFDDYWSGRTSQGWETLFNVWSVVYSCVLMPIILSFILYFVYLTIHDHDRFRDTGAATSTKNKTTGTHHQHQHHHHHHQKDIRLENDNVLEKPDETMTMMVDMPIDVHSPSTC